ncbi:MAG: hypothetical protein RLZZ444_1391, partial [Pseudomonadota bacterium]
DRLDSNIDWLKERLPPTKHLRLVDKSLACLPLLTHVRDRLQTRHIMTFHLPVARAVLEAFPDAELLFGKPMPAEGLDRCLETMAPEERTRFSDQVVQLVDTQERLQAYAAVARRHGIRFRIAFEVDVGLHRGGFATPSDLAEALAELGARTELQAEGLMGYEPHIGSIPALFGGPAREARNVDARLKGFIATLPATMRSIINTGGSQTITRYLSHADINDLSIGSGLLKPTDFDAGLPELSPALFIATPILKIGAAQLPGPEWMTSMLKALGLFPKKGCFIYGGKWMAEPVHPQGLADNSLFGHSSNQQFMALPSSSPANVGDLAFFRPTQSEAVLQQFGPIAVYSKEKIVDHWQPLPTG